MNREEELIITHFSESGHGHSLLKPNSEGKSWPVEIPFAIPGDHVNVLLGKRKRGIHSSKLLRLMAPSPDRIQAKCAHFGDCGGCRLQQIDYSSQLVYKESFVRKQFNGLKLAEAVWRSIVGCEEPWRYRNKMEYSFGYGALRKMGLMASFGRGRVVDLEECYLTREWFANTLKAARSWWRETDLEAYYPPRDAGSLRTLTLREGMHTGDRLAALTVSGNPDFALSLAQRQAFLESMLKSAKPEDSGSLTVVVREQKIAKKVPTRFEETVLSGPGFLKETLTIDKGGGRVEQLTFKVSPFAFFQPNPKQAERLYSLAIQLADLKGGEVVYDLYCGTGTLGMFAASSAKQVIGIELNAEAVADAKENLLLNGVENMNFFQGDVGEVLSSIALGKMPPPDVVFVDPPRAGLEDKALQQLILLSPKKIIYVSCNPVSQAKNVKVLIDNGFEIKTIQPVDQFPHTLHVENIVLSTR